MIEKMEVDFDWTDEEEVVVGSIYDFCVKRLLGMDFLPYFWGWDTDKMGNHEHDCDLCR